MIEVCSPTQSINHPTEKVMDLSTFFGFTATVAAIVGIVVNAILPGKDYDFQNDYEYGKTTEDHGQML